MLTSHHAVLNRRRCQTLVWGLEYYRALIRWADETLAALERRAARERRSRGSSARR